MRVLPQPAAQGVEHGKDGPAGAFGIEEVACWPDVASACAPGVELGDDLVTERIDLSLQVFA